MSDYNEDDYFPVLRESIRPGIVVPFDCYILLRRNQRIIHIIKKGFVAPADVMDKLHSHKIPNIYLPKELFDDYKAYLKSFFETDAGQDVFRAIQEDENLSKELPVELRDEILAEHAEQFDDDYSDLGKVIDERLVNPALSEGQVEQVKKIATGIKWELKNIFSDNKKVNAGSVSFAGGGSIFNDESSKILGRYDEDSSHTMVKGRKQEAGSNVVVKGLFDSLMKQYSHIRVSGAEKNGLESTLNFILSKGAQEIQDSGNDPEIHQIVKESLKDKLNFFLFDFFSLDRVHEGDEIASKHDDIIDNYVEDVFRVRGWNVENEGENKILVKDKGDAFFKNRGAFQVGLPPMLRIKKELSHLRGIISEGNSEAHQGIDFFEGKINQVLEQKAAEEEGEEQNIIFDDFLLPEPELDSSLEDHILVTPEYEEALWPFFNLLETYYFQEDSFRRFVVEEEFPIGLPPLDLFQKVSGLWQVEESASAALEAEPEVSEVANPFSIEALHPFFSVVQRFYQEESIFHEFISKKDFSIYPQAKSLFWELNSLWNLDVEEEKVALDLNVQETAEYVELNTQFEMLKKENIALQDLLKQNDSQQVLEIQHPEKALDDFQRFVSDNTEYISSLEDENLQKTELALESQENYEKEKTKTSKLLDMQRDLDHKLDRAEEEIRQYQDTISDLRRTLGEREKDVKRLGQDVENLKKNPENKKSEENIGTLLKKREHDLSRTQDQLDSEKERTKMLNKEIDLLKQNQEKLNLLKKSLAEKVATTEHQQKMFALQERALNKKIVVLTNLNSQTRKTIARLTNFNEKLQKEKTLFQKKARQGNPEAQGELQKRIKLLEKQLDAALQNTGRAQGMQDKNDKKMMELKTQYAEETKKNADLTREIKKLKIQLERMQK